LERDENALVPSKYRPADVDPNINVNLNNKNEINIQMALHLLGIDKKIVYRTPLSGTIVGAKGKRKESSFWNRPSEFLWRMLELAKDRYKYEIQHAHPDVGGDPQRAIQLNTAWEMIKKSFARRGYILPGHEPVGYHRKAPVDKKSKSYKKGWI
jgi:hypothetical protein